MTSQDRKKPTTKKSPKPRTAPTTAKKPLTYPMGSLAWAFSLFPGGHLQAVRYLFHSRSRDEAAILGFMSVFNALSDKERRDPESLDRVCDETGFPPKKFMEYVVGQAFEFQNDVVNYLRRIQTPLLYMRSVEEALAPGSEGFKDRTAILQNEGLHFAPRGISVNVNQNNQQVNVDRGLPNFTETVHRLHEVLVGDDFMEAEIVDSVEQRSLPESSAGSVDLMNVKAKEKVKC